MMRQLLKYGINVLDKENITEDQIKYVYKKWSAAVAERLVKMLKDETKRARITLEKLKKTGKKKITPFKIPLPTRRKPRRSPIKAI